MRDIGYKDEVQNRRVIIPFFNQNMLVHQGLPFILMDDKWTMNIQSASLLYQALHFLLEKYSLVRIFPEQDAAELTGLPAQVSFGTVNSRWGAMRKAHQVIDLLMCIITVNRIQPCEAFATHSYILTRLALPELNVKALHQRPGD